MEWPNVNKWALLHDAAVHSPGKILLPPIKFSLEFSCCLFSPSNLLRLLREREAVSLAHVYLSVYTYSASRIYDEIMISLALWRARIGLFVPKSTGPWRELLADRHEHKHSFHVYALSLLLALVMSSVTLKPKILVGNVDTSGRHRKKQSKCQFQTFFCKPIATIMVLTAQNRRLLLKMKNRSGAKEESACCSGL